MSNDSDQHMLSRMMDGDWDGLDPSRCAALVSQNPIARARWARYHMIRDVLNNEPVHIDTDLASRVRQAITDEPAYSNVARLQGASESRAASGESERDVAASPIEATLVTVPREKTAAAGGEPARRGSTRGAESVPRAWGRAASGLAVAASMALVTVVGLNLLERGAPGTGPAVSQVATNASAERAAPTLTANAPVVNESGNLPGTVLPQVEYVANRGSHWVTGSQERQADTERRLNMFLSQHIENSPTAEHQGMLPYSRLVGYDELPAE